MLDGKLHPDRHGVWRVSDGQVQGTGANAVPIQMVSPTQQAVEQARSSPCGVGA